MPEDCITSTTVPQVSIICSVFVATHLNLLYMSLLDREHFKTFFPAYFYWPGLNLCHYLNSDYIVYANWCSFKGLHLIRIGDCWLKCVFLGNLFTCLLWEVMLSTFANFWSRQKNKLYSRDQISLFMGTFKGKIIKNSIFILFQPNFQDIFPMRCGTLTRFRMWWTYCNKTSGLTQLQFIW